MQAPGDVTRSFRRSFRNSVPLNLDQLSKRNPCSGKIAHVHPTRINKSTLTTNFKLQLSNVKQLYRTFRDHVIFELKIHENMAAVGNVSSFTCSKFSGKQQNKQIMIRKACTKLGACQQPLWISQDPCDDCLFSLSGSQTILGIFLQSSRQLWPDSMNDLLCRQCPFCERECAGSSFAFLHNGQQTTTAKNALRNIGRE